MNTLRHRGTNFSSISRGKWEKNYPCNLQDVAANEPNMNSRSSTYRPARGAPEGESRRRSWRLPVRGSHYHCCRSTFLQTCPFTLTKRRRANAPKSQPQDRKFSSQSPIGPKDASSNYLLQKQQTTCDPFNAPLQPLDFSDGRAKHLTQLQCGRATENSCIGRGSTGGWDLLFLFSSCLSFSSIILYSSLPRVYFSSWVLLVLIRLMLHWLGFRSAFHQRFLNNLNFRLMDDLAHQNFGWQTLIEEDHQRGDKDRQRKYWSNEVSQTQLHLTLKLKFPDNNRLDIRTGELRLIVSFFLLSSPDWRVVKSPDYLAVGCLITWLAGCLITWPTHCLIRYLTSSNQKRLRQPWSDYLIVLSPDFLIT